MKTIKNKSEETLILKNKYGIVLDDNASFLTKGTPGKYYEGTERSIWV